MIAAGVLRAAEADHVLAELHTELDHLVRSRTPSHFGGDLRQRALRLFPEVREHIPEVDIQVEDGDVRSGNFAERRGQIRRDERLARATLRGEDRHDPTSGGVPVAVLATDLPHALAPRESVREGIL